MSDFKKKFENESFFQNIMCFINKAGRAILENAFALYYCLKDAETPIHVKAIIIGCLGYFVFPFDIIPDLIPALGFIDDLALLMMVTKTVIRHIKLRHRQQARELLSLVRNRKNQTPDDHVNQKKQGPFRFVSEADKEKHYLRILDIEGEITMEVLKEHYRTLVHKYHPDKVRHLGAEFQEMASQRLLEINESYEYLRKHVVFRRK